jgi:hypothetical protein
MHEKMDESMGYGIWNLREDRACAGCYLEQGVIDSDGV